MPFDKDATARMCDEKEIKAFLPFQGQITRRKSAKYLLWAYTVTPERFSAGFLLWFAACAMCNGLADRCFARLM
jgi:hypothetical protein